jgi:hypothetical protein
MYLLLGATTKVFLSLSLRIQPRFINYYSLARITIDRRVAGRKGRWAAPIKLKAAPVTQRHGGKKNRSTRRNEFLSALQLLLGGFTSWRFQCSHYAHKQ